MSDNDREVLSQLMDGEWGELDASRCLADACASEEEQQKWARYHLAKDAMRGEAVDSSFSIASAVSAAIADEPTYSNVTSIGDASAKSSENSIDAAQVSTPAVNKGARRWGKGLGLGAAGFGIAASAALATVVGLDYWQNRSISDGSLPTIVAGTSATRSSMPTVQNLTSVPGQQPAIELVSNRGSYWVSGQNGQRVGAETRLNQLLGDHIEHSPVGEWNGVLPYSRLVGYDALAAPEQ